MLLFSKNHVFYKDNLFADKAQKIYRKNAASEKAFCSFAAKAGRLCHIFSNLAVIMCGALRDNRHTQLRSMADKMTPEQRHLCMSHIRSRNTKPEILVRRWLWHYGYRYRLNVRSITGTPDIVLSRYRTVIFINGCFWHGHDCDKFRLPKSNTEFWRKKIERNRNRDNENFIKLRAEGWHVVVLWECQLSRQNFFITMQTLDYRLSHYLIDQHTSDTHNTQIAAEPSATYSPTPSSADNPPKRY